MIMKPLTIKDLYNACEKQMLRGNGDKIVLVTNDEEGNGYHELWYPPYDDEGDLQKLIDMRVIRNYAANEIVVMG